MKSCQYNVIVMFKCFPIFGIRHIPAVAQKQQVVSTYIKQDWLRYASPGAWGFSPPLAAGTLCEWRGCDLPCVDNNRSGVGHLVMSVADDHFCYGHLALHALSTLLAPQCRTLASLALGLCIEG